jgi:hypothetical protein
VTGFGDAMRAAGFGTDPDGDARRRATTVTGEEWLAAHDRLGALADHPPVEGHLLTYRTTRAGTEATCQCGRWDGWFTGPRSRRRVLDDHAEHVAAELRAAGPLRVEAVRADRPELPPREEAGP